MDEGLPSDTAPRRLKNQPNCVKQVIIVSPDARETTFRQGDPCIPNSCAENNHGDRQAHLSALNDVTENGNDVSVNSAGMSGFVGDDSNMRDIQHSPSALYQNPMCEQNIQNPNQIYEPDVCPQPAHRPANSDDNPGIDPSAATHQEGDDDDNDKLRSDAAAENNEISDEAQDGTVEGNAPVRPDPLHPKPTSRPADKDLIKPCSVRYQEHNEDNIGGADSNRGTHCTAPDDVDCTPYAVFYMCPNGTTDVTRGDAPMDDADTSASVGNDSDVQRTGHHRVALHHNDPSSMRNALNPNPMYAPNGPPARGRTKKLVRVVGITVIVLALLILGGTFFGLYFIKMQDDQKVTESATTMFTTTTSTPTTFPTTSTTTTSTTTTSTTTASTTTTSTTTASTTTTLTTTTSTTTSFAKTSQMSSHQTTTPPEAKVSTDGVVITSIHTATCADGYTMWRGICYRAFETKKKFRDAAATCREHGGTLAMPLDAATNAFLVSLYGPVAKLRIYWIGLHDQRREGIYEWVDGSALGWSYNSWAPQEPDDHGDCVHAYSRSGRRGRWVSSKCNNRLTFICQVVPGRRQVTS